MSIFTENICRVIGAPLSDGQDVVGVELAPQSLRVGGLAESIKSVGWQYEDEGDLDLGKSKSNENIKYEDSKYNGKEEENHCTTTSITSTSTSTPPSTSSSITITNSSSSSINGRYTTTVDDLYYKDTVDILNCHQIGTACCKVFNAVRTSARAKRFSLIIGGDHSIGSATIAASLCEYPDLVVMWIDAHGDCNIPETSPSRHYHGMPAAHVLGWFKKKTPSFGWIEEAPQLKEERIAFIGLRDLDASEREMMTKSNIHCFSMQHIDRSGIGKVMEKALHLIDPEGRRPIHLSLDIDSCDPAVAPGTGTRARGGLTYREIHYICEVLAETRRLVSMDLVEVNPMLDVPDDFMHGDQLPIKPDASKTVRLGIELVSSALGKVIL